jgi:fermentation-respiration switch protein FrsA (DUF1100 family)
MLKMVAFVLLAWSLGGPLIELVDHWDNLQGEIADIACSAGGRLTLILMGVSVALSLAQMLKQRGFCFSRNRRAKCHCPCGGESTAPVIEVSVTESPPSQLVPLRI